MYKTVSAVSSILTRKTGNEKNISTVEGESEPIWDKASLWVGKETNKGKDSGRFVYALGKFCRSTVLRREKLDKNTENFEANLNRKREEYCVI